MVRVRVRDPLLARWDQVLTEHNISGQDALTALIEFVVGEEPLTRSMLFKQVPGTDRTELTRIVLRRLVEAGKKPRKAT